MFLSSDHSRFAGHPSEWSILVTTSGSGDITGVIPNSNSMPNIITPDLVQTQVRLRLLFGMFSDAQKSTKEVALTADCH